VPLRRKLAAAGLVVYTLALVAVLLGPSPEAGDTAIRWTRELLTSIGAPDKLKDPLRIEFLLNVAIFAPWAALAALVWPQPSWRDWTAYGFVATSVVETVQALVYPDRTAAFSDIAANTLGALIGSVVVTLGRALARARRGGD
jgi:glycopeptide antibiotics resistance protein